jgi:hypothetical protein
VKNNKSNSMDPVFSRQAMKRSRSSAVILSSTLRFLGSQVIFSLLAELRNPAHGFVSVRLLQFPLWARVLHLIVKRFCIFTNTMDSTVWDASVYTWLSCFHRKVIFCFFFFVSIVSPSIMTSSPATERQHKNLLKNTDSCNSPAPVNVYHPTILDWCN